MLRAKQYIPPSSNDGFSRFLNVKYSKGAFKCSSPLDSENCKFEIKYLRIKAILDVVSAQADKGNPGTPIWLSQLKTNVKWDGHFNTNQ